MAIFNGELQPRYSTDFLQLIDNYTISQNIFDSFDNAYESVRSGQNRGMISIGANFTKALIQRGIDGYNIDEETIDMSNIKLYLDMTSETQIH